MGLWIFGKKREDDQKIEELHVRVSESFSRVRKEMEKIGSWINHLDEHKKKHQHQSAHRVLK